MKLSGSRVIGRWLPASIVALTAVAVSACGPGESEPSSAPADAAAAAEICQQPENQDGTLVLGHSYIIPEQWNPITAPQGEGQSFYYRLVYGALTRIDADGLPQPDLAESWEYSDDGRQVTFKLRSGLEFTDGTPLNAETAAASFEFALTDETSIVRGPLADVEKVSATGADEIVFQLSRPNHQLPLILGGVSGMLVSPTALEKPASLQRDSHGHGPFQIESVQEGGVVTLTRNPDYWNVEDVHLAKVELNFINDEPARVAAMQSGQLDIGAFLGTSVPGLEGAGFEVIANPTLSYRAISLKRTEPPLDDPKVVEAINHAIDRAAIAETLEGDRFAAPAFQPYPKEYEVGFVPELDDRYPYDPEKAKQLLAEAGHADGLELPYGVLQTLAYPQMAEILQQQLGAVGITLKFHSIPFEKIGPETRVAHLHSFWGDGFPGLTSPLQTAEGIWGENGPWNADGPGAKVAPPLTDAMSTLARTALDDPAYPDAVKGVVRQGVDTLAPIFIYTVKYPVAYDSSVINFTPNPVQFQLDGVCIAEEA